MSDNDTWMDEDCGETIDGEAVGYRAWHEHYYGDGSASRGAQTNDGPVGGGGGTPTGGPSVPPKPPVIK